MMRTPVVVTLIVAPFFFAFASGSTSVALKVPRKAEVVLDLTVTIFFPIGLILTIGFILAMGFLLAIGLAIWPAWLAEGEGLLGALTPSLPAAGGTVDWASAPVPASKNEATRALI